MATSDEPARINLRNVSEIACQPAVEDSVDALLRASDGDPVTAIAAMAEAVWKRNNGKFAGADAVLYRTLQAQLSGKYRSVLEGPGGSSPHRTGGGIVGKKGPRQPHHPPQQSRPPHPPKAAPGDDHGQASPSPYGGTGPRPQKRLGGTASPHKPHASSLRAAPAGGAEAADASPAKSTKGRNARIALPPDGSELPEGEAEVVTEGEGSPAPGGGLQPHRAGAKAYSSMSTRKSLRGLRSMSAPVPPRPPKARSVPGGDKSATLESTLDAKKKTGKDRAGSSVDIHSWLMDRRRKEREREEMRQSRLKNDARFIEKLDERQAERNKLLQEAEERMAQNVAGKKGQKWKPVPFTPWPEANKAQEVVTEDTIFKKDVERLFGAFLGAEDKAAQGGSNAAGGARIPTPKGAPSGAS